MEVPPYKYFRCSSDRHVTAGITEGDEAKWYNLPQADRDGFPLKISRNGKENEFQIANRDVFGVSPNGNYLVSVISHAIKHGTLNGLCVIGPNNETSCVDHYADTVAVSDNGDVVFWAGELGVMYWRPGLRAAHLLEKGAEKPQWVTPEAAAALQHWNAIRRVDVSRR
jgi:hypothetical protein